VLRSVDVRYTSSVLRAPAAVGWVRDWWGKDDPTLNEDCEIAPRYLEDKVPRLLKEVEDLWPYSPADRALVAQFIALHVIRSDAGRDRVMEAREAALTQLRTAADDPALVECVAATVSTDRSLAQRLYGQVNKFASIFASMHWTLLHFDEPWLITSDQPVCPVPLLHQGETAQIDGSAGKGWIDMIEVRFPLGPRHALLATWVGPEHAEAAIPGSWQDAVNLNAASRAQARRQRFYDPRCSPPSPSLISREATPRSRRSAPRGFSATTRHRRSGPCAESASSRALSA
jgi:hypothetical protein